jgi:hypothetical protein
MELILAASALTLAAFLAFLWQGRVRSSRRWRALLDSYAEREIARLSAAKGMHT